jgi:hypothetical protein
MVIMGPTYAEIKSYNEAEHGPLRLMPNICSALKEVGLDAALGKMPPLHRYSDSDNCLRVSWL